MKEQFSPRVKGIEISGIRRIFEAAGPDSINLGLGQPDFDTPQHIKDAAIAAIRAGKTGYTANTGIPESGTRSAPSSKKRTGCSMALIISWLPQVQARRSISLCRHS